LVAGFKSDLGLWSPYRIKKVCRDSCAFSCAASANSKFNNCVITGENYSAVTLNNCIVDKTVFNYNYNAGFKIYNSLIPYSLISMEVGKILVY
jgi:hypothetical protein